MEKRRIGEYLLDEKKITPQQLDQALSTQTRRSRIGAKPMLGTVLVEMGWINQNDLESALEQQQRQHGRYY